MHVRLVAALAFAGLAALPARAFAWQEAHLTGAGARVRVEPSGMASIALQLRWHLVHGPLRSVDLAGIDPSAVVDADAHVSAEDGRDLAAHAARQDDGTVRVTLDEAHPLSKGTVVLDVLLREDLVLAQALTPDGPRWRLAWTAPVASDGIDGATTTFELPAAPDPPQPIVAQTGAVDGTALATLRRQPAEDVLELVRPHVGRGEAATWTVRLDPRGMTQVTDPRLRPAGEAPAPEPDRVREAVGAVALAGLALALGLLVARKSRGFRAACVERGASPQALLPVPDRARAALAGAGLAAAVGLELAGGEAWLAGVCLAVATLAASLRAPLASPGARGPGRWLALRPQDAFTPTGAEADGPDWLDVGTRAGRLTALLAAAVVAVVALISGRFGATASWFAVLDAAPWIPVWLTGTVSQLPPHPARSAAPWMASVFKRLSSVDALRVAPWARLTASGARPDELRLLVLPRAAMPGLLGVEIGLAWCSTPVGWTARPEVLARVLAGTPAAAKLASELPAVRLIPGRRPDERVAVLPPREPTGRGGASLARALASALADRRVSYPPRVWTAPERREAGSGSSGKDAKQASQASQSGQTRQASHAPTAPRTEKPEEGALAGQTA